MDQHQAISAFGALAQDTRLAIVRMLVKAGPLGMAAGSIAESAGAAASNVSFHLKDLEHAGLVSSRREARSIIYSANFETLRGLISFLMKDCCGGHPEICDPVQASARCVPVSKKTRRKERV
ncbi:metalloregulator ArsR/SmtB family transcription factor [[Pseudomonas] carboxydohydrogena]|uniref:Metalloregulator ArsR/SmtB family transcription factor n=1 Tax=Afipia carboxydohydrogena TaxID=290 RepID=A0ABY8BRI4_AFICR|nr:metalloregulator ArsR/SmtB family transcription factor [[Pseudomonas] carboxydohydrogena]WEF52610.1 metalloregulator ArsR/SmtB family transcription factor [[Pseudomonas] carboxydohydrogena]